MKFVIAIIVSLTFYASQSFAHEMIPTYPEMRPSIYDGLYSIKLNIFNRRNDVFYYEIGVFDEDWKPLPFGTKEKIIKLDYLNKKDLEIYIREAEKNKVTYICTTSKLIKGDVKFTAVTSKICSKIKRDEK